jgi:hypothetical protein
MKSKSMLYGVRIGFVMIIFAMGFLCGSMTQHNANAGLDELGGELMQKASESGGALGTAAQLGTTITDMQKHITGLQNNLETIKKVKSMLGGK